ncbi:uncharacterized [Tachysurus ichikawai]
MAQAAKHLRKNKDLEALAEQERKEKEEKVKKRSRSRDKKRKVLGQQWCNVRNMPAANTHLDTHFEPYMRQ